MHIQQVISTLSNRFSLKDLGFLNYFLGVEVIRRDDGLILSQSKYVLDILHDSNMPDSKGVLTPMSSHHTLVANDGAPLTDATKYQKVIGKLQYLSFTRPDISYSVNKLSQFMSALILKTNSSLCPSDQSSSRPQHVCVLRCRLGRRPQ